MALDKDTEDFVDKEISQAMAFTTAKYGDTPTDAQQLTPKKYVDTQITSVYSAIVTPTTSSFPYFGDGSDGTVSISSSIATLTKDMHYQNLTLSSSASLNTNGWRIFVASILTIDGNSTIKFNGSPGSVGGSGAGSNSGGVGGKGAGSVAGNTVGGTIAGGNGGDGANSAVANSSGINGNRGSIGGIFDPSIGNLFVTNNGAVAGGGGDAGGRGGGVGGRGAQPGSSLLGARNSPGQSVVFAYEMFDVTGSSIASLTTSIGANGGGGGASGACDGGTLAGQGGNGGGGGGAGSTGGIVAIYARHLVNTVTAGIQALGGDGGNAGNGSTMAGGNFTSAGGGGGGSGGQGGTGGVVMIIYHSSVMTGTISVSGGNAGAGGTGAVGSGLSFSNGSDGGSAMGAGTGKIYQIQV